MKAHWIALAILMFALLAGGAYWMWGGSRSPEVWQPIATVTYVCDGEKRIVAAYDDGPQAPQPKPGAPPTLTGSVQVSLDGAPAVTLPQTISASGIRYANADGTFIFWSKGSEALLMQGGEMDSEYVNCHDGASASAAELVVAPEECPAGTARVGEGCMPLKDECELQGDAYVYDEDTGACTNTAEIEETPEGEE